MLAHVDPTDQHLTVGRVEQPRDQVEQRGLARAGAPDDGERLARLDAEVEVVQHRLLGARERELGVPQLERHRAGELGDAVGGIDHRR